jgi:hypothetical protein
MIDRQEARSDVARIDPAADRWYKLAQYLLKMVDAPGLFSILFF